MLVALLVAALFRAPAPGSATADHTVVTILIAGSLYYLLESPAFDIGI